MTEALDEERVLLWLHTAERAVAGWAHADQPGANRLLTNLRTALDEGLLRFDLHDTEVPSARQRAHHNAPETSLEAATMPPERLRRQQARVLRVYWLCRDLGGMTNEELEAAVARYGWPMFANTLRPRNLELRRYGYVEDAELRRVARSGKNAVVWRLTSAGRSAASNLMPEDWT